jgi:capsular polysaccharide biosynthesis protein
MIEEARKQAGWGVYGELLRQYWWRLGLISMFAALMALGVVQRMGSVYEVNFSYLVSLSEREENATEYRYDGYYTFQVTTMFAETLARWITVPELMAEAYETAGLTVPDNSRTLRQAVRAEKVAPQLVVVAVRNKSKERAEALTKGVNETVSAYVNRYNQQSVPGPSFTVMPTVSRVSEEKIAKEIVAAAVFIFCWLIGINILFLREAIKRSE